MRIPVSVPAAGRGDRPHLDDVACTSTDQRTFDWLDDRQD
jgi:hypothetical protein